MRYLYAMKGGMISFAFFLFLVFLLGSLTFVETGKDEVKLVLTISTFLFAILVGFFITRLNARYNAIRENTAEEDAYWLAFYKNTAVFGKKFQSKIRDLIDEYYIIAFDSDIVVNYKPTMKIYKKIYNELVAIKKIKNEKENNLYDDMFSILLNIEIRRNKSAIVILEKLTTGQWSIIIALASMIVFSIFYLSNASFYLQAASVILSTTLVLILLIMRDLQNLRPSGQLIMAESGEEIFELLGKLRYYNEIHLKDYTNVIPKHVKKYRLGVNKPGDKIKIKIVTK